MAAITTSGCAYGNFDTIDYNYKAKPSRGIQFLHGDAKQTLTVVESNWDRLNAAGTSLDPKKSGPEFIACAPRNPPVFSAYSQGGTFGVSPKGSIPSISLNGSEVSTALTPLAIVQVNEDARNTECWDRLNGWVDANQYFEAEQNLRAMTLAAFAFEALAKIGNSGSGATKPTDTTSTSKMGNNGQSSQTPGKSGTGPGQTGEAVPGASLSRPSNGFGSGFILASEVIAPAPPSAGPHGTHVPKKKPVKNKKKVTQSNSASPSPTDSTNKTNDASSAGAVAAAQALTAIYRTAIQPMPPLVSFCLSAVSDSTFLQMNSSAAKESLLASCAAYLSKVTIGEARELQTQADKAALNSNVK